MNSTVARAVALSAHVGQLTRLGEPLIAHLERVAAKVPAAAAATAWLHDLGEREASSVHDLLANGITPSELTALELLTFADGEDYGLYLQRIARAPGDAGALARAVKRAELEDHLDRLPSWGRSTGRYKWALDQIERGQRRNERRLGKRQIEAA
jgi:hypothetical protein